MRLATGDDPKAVFDIKETPAPEATATPADETKADETPAETPAEEPEATPEAEETEESDTEDTPEPEAAETPEKGKEKAGPDRFRFKSEEDRAVALLSKTLGVSLVEAAKRFEAMKGTKPAAAETPAEPEAETIAPPEAPPELAEIDQQVTALDTRIKDLTALRAKAVEEFDNAKILELSDQLSDAKLEKASLKTRRESLQRESTSAHENAWRSAAEKSRDAAFAEFPVLADAESEKRLAFDAYVQRVRQDPKRAAVFNSPSWPLRLAREYDQKNGLKTAAAAATPAATKPLSKATTPPATKPAAAPKPKPALVQVPGAKLLNGADGTNPSASRPPLSETDALANLAKLSASERLRVAAML